MKLNKQKIEKLKEIYEDIRTILINNGVDEILLDSHNVSGSIFMVNGQDGRTYYPNSLEEWYNGELKQKGDKLYRCELIKTYN